MQLSFDKSLSILREHLNADELGRGVAYLAETPIRAGEILKLPKLTISVQWPAWLAFVDREPLANWGHSCRYILINRETSELSSTEARLPPFEPRNALRWRVVYQAKGVPDTALGIKR